MRKKIIAYILLAGMLFSAPATAHAESLTSERNVSFTSENKLSTDYESGDVDSVLSDAELQLGEVVEIDDGLKPYYFYYLSWSRLVPVYEFNCAKVKKGD